MTDVNDLVDDRPRSHWAWGYEDRLADAAARAGIAQMVAAMLRCAVPAVAPLPSIADARVPDARHDVPDELAAFTTADRDARIRHTYGRAFVDLVRGFSGDFSSAPDLVAFARGEDDVQRVLSFCAREGVAVVPYGGGTSVVRGVECDRDARRAVLSLDLRAMNRVLELDEVSRTVLVEAGATGPLLEQQLARAGMTLRHYPQSFEFSTVGGWIATRAGGHFATGYTHIDERLHAVRMLTPTGVFETRRLPGDGAGPAPERLVLGSEGTLGVITRAWLRVLPRPRWRASASARFASFAQGVSAARSVVQAGLTPANLRLLDANEAQLNGVADGSVHVLLLGFESHDASSAVIAAGLERARQLCVDAGAVSVSDARLRDEQGGARDVDAGSWRAAFVDAPYLQSTLVSLGMLVDTFETACAWSAFEALHAAVVEAVESTLRARCGGGRVSCRFTHVYPDGPAPYYTFVAPPPAGGREALLDAWWAVKSAASDALLANGGTITHHHAVGRTHRPWYARQRPEPFDRALRAVRDALDPSRVLNPGVLTD